jgi:hypothetical protein
MRTGARSDQPACGRTEPSLRSWLSTVGITRLAAIRASGSRLRYDPTVGLGPGVAPALHSDEIPIDAELVRSLVSRVMPAYADSPIRRLASSGSTNALFRLGEEFLVRLPRQPGGSATISKEARWLPVLGRLLSVSVPDVVAVFEPDRGYPERWSVVRWIDGSHPEVVGPDTSVDPRREHLAKNLATVLDALRQAEVPMGAGDDPHLQSYRGEPLVTMDKATRENIERCRSLEDFDLGPAPIQVSTGRDRSRSARPPAAGQPVTPPR